MYEFKRSGWGLMSLPCLMFEQATENNYGSDSERHSAPELDRKTDSESQEADSEEEDENGDVLVEEHFPCRKSQSVPIGARKIHVNNDDGRAVADILHDNAQSLQSPLLSPDAIEFSPLSPLYPSPGVPGVAMVKMPLSVSVPSPHLPFKSSEQPYLARGSSSDSIIGPPSISSQPLQVFEGAPQHNPPVAMPGVLLNTVGLSPAVTPAASPVGPHHYSIPGSVTPLTLPPTTTGREHVTRALLLSNVATDISDAQLRAELPEWGPVRWINLELRREGLVTVHYFDLRHAMSALHDIQHQHLLQQQRVQQQLQAGLQRLGLASQSGESKQGFRDVVMQNVPARGLIGGRPAWAQYVTAVGVSGPNSDNQGTLVVFNIDADMPQSELRRLFEVYGTVKELRENPEKKQHKFVEFYDVRNAASALAALDGKEVNGRKLKIEFSRPGGQAVRDRRMRQQLAQAQANQSAMIALTAGSHLGFVPNHGPTVVPLIGWPGDPNTGVSAPYSTSPVGASQAFMWTSYNPLATAMAATPSPQLSPTMNSFMPGGFVPCWLPTGSRMPGRDHTGFNSNSQAYAQQGGLQPVSFVPPMQHVGGGMGLLPMHSNIMAPSASLTPAMDVQSYMGAGRAICIPSGSLPSQLPSPHSRSLDSSGPNSPCSGKMASQNKGEGWQWGSSAGISILDVSSTSSSSQSGSGKQSIVQRTPKGSGRSGHTPKSASWENVSSHYAFEEGSSEQIADANRTTIMIKNIPNKYSQAMLLQMLDLHCAGCNDARTDESQPISAYDFVYLPIDFKNKCNLGYAFVNFTSVHATGMLYRRFHSKQWEAFNSRKVCQVTYARVQGRAALEDHFKNSRFACDTEEYLPLVFDPPRDGINNTPPTVAAGHTGRPFGRRDGHSVSSGYRGGRSRRSRSMSPSS